MCEALNGGLDDVHNTNISVSHVEYIGKRKSCVIMIGKASSFCYVVYPTRLCHCISWAVIMGNSSAFFSVVWWCVVGPCDKQVFVYYLLRCLMGTLVIGILVYHLRGCMRWMFFFFLTVFISF